MKPDNSICINFCMFRNGAWGQRPVAKFFGQHKLMPITLPLAFPLPFTCCCCETLVNFISHFL